MTKLIVKYYLEMANNAAGDFFKVLLPVKKSGAGRISAANGGK